MPHSVRVAAGAWRPVADESHFEREVVRLAHLYGWCGYHVRNSAGVTRGVHTRRFDPHGDAWGFPDWVFWHPVKQVVLFRELKTEVGVLDRDQRRVIADLSLSGADVRVWRPKDWNEIVAALSGGLAARTPSPRVQENGER